MGPARHYRCHRRCASERFLGHTSGSNSGEQAVTGRPHERARIPAPCPRQNGCMTDQFLVAEPGLQPRACSVEPVSAELGDACDGALSASTQDRCQLPELRAPADTFGDNAIDAFHRRKLRLNLPSATFVERTVIRCPGLRPHRDCGRLVPQPLYQRLIHHLLAKT